MTNATTTKIQITPYVTDKDREAVKRLRDYYRRNSASGASDESFTVWLKSVLKIIRAEDMQRVRQIMSSKRRNEKIWQMYRTHTDRKARDSEVITKLANRINRR
jgi:hypothetical protein